MLPIESIRDFFSNQGDVTRINDSICTVFELIQDFTNVSLIRKFQEATIKTERYADDKVKQRLFQHSRGSNCKINDSIWQFLSKI